VHNEVYISHLQFADDNLLMGSKVGKMLEL